MLLLELLHSLIKQCLFLWLVGCWTITIKKNVCGLMEHLKQSLPILPHPLGGFLGGFFGFFCRFRVSKAYFVPFSLSTVFYFTILILILCYIAGIIATQCCVAAIAAAAAVQQFCEKPNLSEFDLLWQQRMASLHVLSAILCGQYSTQS